MNNQKIDLRPPETHANEEEIKNKKLKRKFSTVKTAEKWWIENARKSPYYFIWYLTELQPADHHVEWLRQIFDFDKANKHYRLNFIAPRESAKTTVVLYSLIWYMSRFPFKSNILVSVSARQAEDRLNMIRNIIEHNPRYRNVFPHIVIDPHQRNTLQQFSLEAKGIYDPKTNSISEISYSVWRSLVARLGSSKDPTFFATGAGGKNVIGRRINGFLIMDDIIDESMLNLDLQNQMYRYIMSTLIPLLQDDAKAINIGTRWMIDDVPERLEKNPEWTTTKIQAIQTDPETGELRSYWPDYWPVEKLLRRKAEMDNDALFEIMYQSNPLAMTSARFTQASLSVDLPSPLPHLTHLYVGTDFAISTKQRADWTVFAAVGIDSQRNIYILDMHRIKASPDGIQRELGAFCMRIMQTYGKLTGVLIEKVGFQTWALPFLVEKFPHLPAYDVPLTGDKGFRLEALAQKASAGELYVNQKMSALSVFVAEAINFPLHAHDDTLDAVTIVLMHANISASSVKVYRVRSSHLI